ncbi:hypothetical protein [Streptomyces sp. NPDC057257]|uniref:hypothetical protein n=1 Tax=Streptomyces sp. NPDC057257 TaxID=3346071 RepID=UPI00362CCADC
MTEPLHRHPLRRTTPDTVEDTPPQTMPVLWRRADDMPGPGGRRTTTNAKQMPETVR